MTTTLNRRQVEAEVTAKLHECKQIAAAKGYPIDFKIEFLYRGTNGGHYKHSTKTVAINIALACLNESNKKHILEDTCAHECIHAAEQQHFTLARNGSRRSVHGWRFYHLGRVIFNKNFERCHNMEVEGVARVHARPFIYSCNCSEHKITTIRHNKMLKGAQYRCAKCRSSLTYVGNKQTKQVPPQDIMEKFW